MKTFKDLYNKSKKIKTMISSDNFTNILGEDGQDTQYTFKINVEDDFIDDAILALYKAGANKYNLKFELLDNANVSAYLSGPSLNLIKFLLDIADMLYPIIKEKYPKLDFTEYEKLNK